MRAAWTGAVWEPACADIDVAALHQHYLAAAKRGGVELRTRARLVAAEREGGGLAAESTERGERFAPACWPTPPAPGPTASPSWRARAPLGIQPLRRTVAQLRTDPPPPADLPLVLDIAGGSISSPRAAGCG